MNTVREKVAEKLLAEVSSGAPLSWYYISVAGDEEFFGGYLIQARGETEAWVLFHGLGWYPTEVGASTMTTKVPDIGKVPVSMRWRRLTKEDLAEIDRLAKV
jgi:hypothetical protein